MSLFISQAYRRRLNSAGESAIPAGKLVIADAHAARQLVARLAAADDGSRRDLGRLPTAGELAALALLDDAYQKILDRHLTRRDATLLQRVLTVLRVELGTELLDRLLVEFAEEFLGARMDGLSLLAPSTEGRLEEGLDRALVLQEILIFWLLESNPAARPVVSRLHVSPLLGIPAFRQVVDVMIGMLDQEPGPHGGKASLWRLLTRPLRLAPDSLADQLAHLRRIWSRELGDLGSRMDTFLGTLAEEQRPRFPPGPGPVEVPRYSGTSEEVRFSPDRDWMASLVLVAKHTLVWLHQLSLHYAQTIERLDQVPEVELERLASLGFNGLWLIGLWERSPASRKIKQWCGNPEAASSAYSLVRYQVAEELGGEAALDRLRDRAARYGIRLAADMVPNHTGLDSDWMAEHPDWFIGQDQSPFPSYRFSGEDLSERPEMGLYLEDHYFDRSDAAVVFKRVDRQSGRARFIYHGNDGTSTPWNDTAQLDYLNPAVWPAIIETIVAVARRFPIIRFDAAMTLTRRHFHRLWYPAPGSAGDIPSRAEHGLSDAEFEAAMPEEFWRQVVDRVGAEAPDTLLLAEAFWLMEGFFVRTLGMHRVYNSAFMNMLRDGETRKFRALIEETLRFDPGILQRYVNFMSNPDELAAIEQFGDGDRYFGTCVLMATLPGLPMFGHGQIEGLREQYGMEYRRAYRDETPRQDLIARHLRQVAPVLHDREIFAGVDEFRLFPLTTPEGGPHDHVLAFSNGIGARRALVLYNNSDLPVRGFLRTSVPFRTSTGSSEGARATQEIGPALATAEEGILQATDRLSGLHYLYDAAEWKRRGMELTLDRWECRVLEGFMPLAMPAGVSRQLVERLGTGGVSSLEAMRRELEIEPLRELLNRTLSVELLQPFLDDPGGLASLAADTGLVERLRLPLADLSGEAGDRLAVLPEIPAVARRLLASDESADRVAGRRLRALVHNAPEIGAVLYCSELLRLLEAEAPRRTEPPEPIDWRLESAVLPRVVEAGGDPETTRRLLSVLRLARRLGWGDSALVPPAAEDLADQLLADEATRVVLGVNQFEGREYLSREALEALLDLRLALEATAWIASTAEPRDIEGAVRDWGQVLERLAANAQAAAYSTDQLGIGEAEESNADDE